jgi:hypothetical protein
MRSFSSGVSAVGIMAGAALLITFGTAVNLLAEIADATGKPAVVPVPTPPEAPKFFYEVSGEARGPVSLDHLAAMRSLPSESRYVTGETLVCRYGSTQWLRLAEVG